MHSIVGRRTYREIPTNADAVVLKPSPATSFICASAVPRRAKCKVVCFVSVMATNLRSWLSFLRRPCNSCRRKNRVADSRTRLRSVRSLHDVQDSTDPKLFWRRFSGFSKQFELPGSVRRKREHLNEFAMSPDHSKMSNSLARSRLPKLFALSEISKAPRAHSFGTSRSICKFECAEPFTWFRHSNRSKSS